MYYSKDEFDKTAAEIDVVIYCAIPAWTQSLNDI